MLLCRLKTFLEKRTVFLHSEVSTRNRIDLSFESRPFSLEFYQSFFKFCIFCCCPKVTEFVCGKSRFGVNFLYLLQCWLKLVTKPNFSCFSFLRETPNTACL